MHAALGEGSEHSPQLLDSEGALPMRRTPAHDLSGIRPCWGATAPRRIRDRDACSSVGHCHCHCAALYMSVSVGVGGPQHGGPGCGKYGLISPAGPISGCERPQCGPNPRFLAANDRSYMCRDWAGLTAGFRVLFVTTGGHWATVLARNAPFHQYFSPGVGKHGQEGGQ